MSCLLGVLLIHCLFSVSRTPYTTLDHEIMTVLTANDKQLHLKAMRYYYYFYDFKRRRMFEVEYLCARVLLLLHGL